MVDCLIVLVIQTHREPPGWRKKGHSKSMKYQGVNMVFQICYQFQF